MTGILEVIALLLLLGFILNSNGTRTMVDVLSTRVHMFTQPSAGPGSAPASGSPSGSGSGASESGVMNSVLTSLAVRRTMSYQRSQRRTNNLLLGRQVNDRRLFHSKESQWDSFSEARPRPFMGLCCSACNNDNRANAIEVASKTVGLRNILQEEFSLQSSVFRRVFKHLAQAYSVRKFDYPTIYETVLTSERLKEAILMTAKDQCNQRSETSPEALEKLVEQHEVRARQILDEMRSKLSDLLLRLTSWVLLKLLPCFLTSVVVHPTQVEMLMKAGRTGLPLIFLPLHRSHLDYILVSFILLNIDVKCPMVAAGDNLNIPIFGKLLRGLGAFFIKRRIDPAAGKRDTVYRAVLHTYMMQSLQAGHNIEFFAEGGRTRTGKSCMPKGGLLSVIIDAYMDGTVEDALLVPVSLNYEKLVDGNFTREQMGDPKQMESFTSAIRGIWKTLTCNYGSARIDFNQPFSLRDMVNSFQQNQPGNYRKSVLGEEEEDDNDESHRGKVKPEKRVLQSTPSSSSLYGTDVVVEEHRQLVDNIARHVLHDCNRSSAVMSTNIVAFMLLSTYRDGVIVDELATAMDTMRKELEWAGRDMGFSGESIDVINHATKVLGPTLVKQEKQWVSGREVLLVRPVTALPSVIELAYYGNGLLSHFALEAAVATAIFSLLECDPTKASAEEPLKKLSQENILEYSRDVCDMLQLEFIFAKSCQSLDALLLDTLAGFQTSEILTENQMMFTEDENWSRRFARHLENDSDDGEEYDTPGPEYEVNIRNKVAMEKLGLYHCMIRPIIETYMVTVHSIKHLVDCQIPERELMQIILNNIKALLKTGHLKYSESLSTDSIKNALKLLERWEVLECYTQDRVKLYYLATKFDNLDAIDSVITFISNFNIDFIITKET